MNNEKNVTDLVLERVKASFLNLRSSFFSQLSSFFNPLEGNILLAVSGGVDSSVLADAIHKLYPERRCCFMPPANQRGVEVRQSRIGIAHVNFHLRGEDSDRDQEFVRTLSQRYGFEFFTTDFDTLAYADEHKVSVEVAARELRYKWFGELAKREGFALLLTAHNANDNAETLLLNLVRGTGRRGLGGIRPYGPLPATEPAALEAGDSALCQTGRIFVLRPLLEVERTEIEEYANENNLDYCIDKTNSLNDFSRNKIRNQVIPFLQEINPSVVKTLTKDIEKFRVMNSELDSFYESKFMKDSDIMESDDSGPGSGIWHLKHNTIVSALRKKYKSFSIPRSYLFHLMGLSHKYSGVGQQKRKEEFLLNELLQSKGVFLNEVAVKELAKGLFCHIDDEETRLFRFGDYSITSERGELRFYTPSTGGPDSASETVRINAAGEFEFGVFNIKVEKLDANKDGVNSKNFTAEGYSVLDALKVSFPLTIRTMQPGDKFSPFGLKGSKSVADFLNSRKVDLLFKNIIPVITDRDGKIVCLPSLEIDDFFKVTPQTKEILRIKPEVS